jgi:hypothetical protein
VDDFQDVSAIKPILFTIALGILHDVPHHESYPMPVINNEFGTLEFVF